VTVRVTTLKGAIAGRYYTEQLPSYYLDGGEPPGRWFGRGAALLGLEGAIEDDAFLAVMAGLHPVTSDRLGRRYGEDSVRGFDATFSAPKSVSVLFAVGDEQLEREVTEAHDTAVDAVLAWVESQAHTRMRQRGHVVCVDAEGIVAGVFRQHTSRRLDPQLHTHAVIANRVRAPDGRWLALDARTIKIDQRTLSGLYHANLRAELTRRLGITWHQPVNGIAEIGGIDPKVLAEFSQRTRDMENRLDEKLARFLHDLDREPTAKERWRLEREAVVDSRPVKQHSPTAGQLHDEWRSRLGTLGIEPQVLVANTVGRVRRPTGVDQHTMLEMVERALESLGERQSTWRPAEVVRELAAKVPTQATVPADELTSFLQRLADHVAATRCVDLSPPIPAGAVLRGRASDQRSRHRPGPHHPIHPRRGGTDRGVGGTATAARRHHRQEAPRPRCRRVEPRPGRRLPGGGGHGHVGADRRTGRVGQDHRPHPRRHIPARSEADRVRGGAHRRRRPRARHRNRNDRRHGGQAHLRAHPPRPATRGHV
jgi:conjugative relaxase-like TrwC/TraI family protein